MLTQLIIAVLVVGLFASVNATIHFNTGAATSPPTVQQYDKLKNCTQDLSRQPSSIQYLTNFNCGQVTVKDKITFREFTLTVKENQKIDISNHGLTFDAWTFNGTVPGPTLRMTEGDHVSIKVINDKSSKHPHSLHMHSIHSAVNDGVMMGNYPGGMIKPGESFTYQFVAQPFGVYPYHCHMDPIADHINRGLYGMMIIDPKTPRSQMTEFAMLMNGYDMNFDQEGATTIPTNAESQSMQHPNNEEEAAEDGERDNEVYTVNGKAFDYVEHPIQIKTDKMYRIYLVNMLEFDLVNSIHLHGTMFNYMIAGTKITPDFMNDIVTLSQGDRGIIEFKYNYPGTYMFHAHQTEFTDLGWMGSFKVAD